MKYSTNGIYTYAETKVNTTDRPVYCASVLEPVPKEFPACFIREMKHYKERKSVTLAFDDEQYRSVWNVSVSSNKENGALSEANEIMDDAEEAFREMKFIETSRQPENTADPTVYRLVARFERVIGGEDDMPTNT